MKVNSIRSGKNENDIGSTVSRLRRNCAIFNSQVQDTNELHESHFDERWSIERMTKRRNKLRAGISAEYRAIYCHWDTTKRSQSGVRERNWQQDDEEKTIYRERGLFGRSETLCQCGDEQTHRYMAIVSLEDTQKAIRS